MNFCPGELILKLLAWIGEWHQNLSERTLLVQLQCYHVAYVHLFNSWREADRQENIVTETGRSYQVILNRSWLFNNMLIPPVMGSNVVRVSTEMLPQTKISKYLPFLCALQCAYTVDFVRPECLLKRKTIQKVREWKITRLTWWWVL